MTCTCGAVGLPTGPHEDWCGKPETDDYYDRLTRELDLETQAAARAAEEWATE